MVYQNALKPLYAQISELIRGEIRSGKYVEDTALPGERELSLMYEVSRITIRRSLDDLVSEGLLYKRHGSGTFVSPRNIDKPSLRLYGLVEELRLSGHSISIKLLETKEEKPSPEIARELKMKSGEPVFCYLRQISADGIPILLTYSYLNKFIHSLFGNININLASDVIYEHLEQCGYRITNAVQHIQSGRPSATESKHLGCKQRDSVLLLFRTTYIEGGHPAIYTRALYRHDYRLTLNLTRG